MPAPPLGSARIALLVGVDRHLHAPALRGCVNDVALMATVLRRFGFVDDEISQLSDQHATREAILQGLERIRGTCTPTTTVVLHFSGWGVRLPRGDAGGAPIVPWSPEGLAYQAQPPADREYDSALLPHDGTPTEPGSLVHYDDIRAWAAGLPAARTVIILDAPYSGVLFGAEPAGRVVYFGASQASEICYEYFTPDGVAQGALTYFLAQVLLRSAPDVPAKVIFDQVATEIVTRFRFQHPALEVEADRPMFDSDRGTPVADVLVVSRDEGWVTLDAGAAAGLTVQSLWAVYPPGEQPITRDTEKIGKIEITEVRTSDAQAKVLSESSRDVCGPGARVVEEEHHYGEMRLRVAVPDPPETETMVQRLRSMLASVESVQVARAGEGADVTVRLIPAGTSVLTGPTQERRSFDGPMWVVEDSQSRPLMSPVPAYSRNFPYDLRYGLQKLARYYNVLALKNPNRRGLLAGKVALDLYRRGPGDGWVIAEPDPQRAVITFFNGDMLRIEITNHHTAPIHASVLDFGVAATITEVVTGEAIGPGATFSFEGPLFWPERAPGVSGVETLKLIATVYPLDLARLLHRDGMRDADQGGPESSTELWQLLDMALAGRGSRERRPVRLPPEQEWTTVERPFELRR